MSEKSAKNPFLEDIWNFLVGFCMGGANVIPGVSGGTMLFILGAFNKLTGAIADIASIETLKFFFCGNWKQLASGIQWRFLIGIAAGIVVSFATLAKLFVWLLEEHTQLTYAFFFGLIAASIISVNRQIKKHSLPVIIIFLISTAAAYMTVSMVPIDGGDQWYMLMLYGAICIIAMILPGLSGSFLLLIFGQYEKVWNAVGNISRLQFHADEMIHLLLLAVGAVAGLAVFVHLINLLMKHFSNAVMGALTGFMAGAIPRIWPWQHTEIFSGKTVLDAPVCDARLPWIILCAAGGFLLVLLIDLCAKNKTEKKEK